MGRAKRNPSDKRRSKRLASPHRSRCLGVWGVFFLCLIALNLTSQDCPAEEYKFEVGEIEVKPYHFGGYAEVDPVLFGLNRDSRFYRQRFYNRDEGSTLDQQGFTLQLDGAYEKGITRGFVRINSDLQHNYEGWSGETAFYEGFLSLKPSPFVTVDTGKKTMKWGKGYAWNPVAFLDRQKDPDDPTLNLEGFYVASMDYIRSFDGPLKTLSFTPALVPVYGDMNKDFGEEGHLNPAAKLYFLFLDTDVDFMFLAGGSRPHRYGFDFSRNLATNLEVHGEMAWIKDFERSFVDGRGTLIEEQSDVWSYLVGVRYLTARETTYILEYYYNGTGFTEGEMRDYFSLVDRAYDAFLSTGRDTLLQRSQRLTEGRYGRVNPMKNYLYLRISQKDPFDILYFTPAVTWIANVDDKSFTVSPELLYTGFTNLELRLKGTVLAGDEFSEFAEKQNDYRIELRARYYF